ncbi:MAG: hypothetical protein ACLQI7_09580 [Streptosporangiaceae bacterium]
MSELSQALLINVIVLAVVLEADLGPHRKITWFRVLRPLVLAGAIIAIYLKSLSTHGTGLYLELAGLAAGVLLGLLATALMRVYRSPRTGRPVSRSGFGYAALWVAIMGARMAFSHDPCTGSAPSSETWMTVHHVPAGAITDALILNAVVILLTRTLGRAGALPPVSSRDGASVTADKIAPGRSSQAR